MNQWRKEDKWFIKETEQEFKVISCIGFISIENNDYSYSPALHTVSKLDYPESKINEIAYQMFLEKSNEMSLPEKIVYISAFIGNCEDLKDSNNNRLWITFDNNRQATDEELENKLLSIIKDFNL